MRGFHKIAYLLLVSSLAAVAAEPAARSSSLSFDQTVDRIVANERTFVTRMRTLHPLAETYIQNLREDSDHNVDPVSDQYFLGRVDLNSGPHDALFEKEHEGSGHHKLSPF
jgi:hypothetical protein